MRTAAKVDATQGEVIHAFRAAGCSVQSLASVGKGVPDLLVGYRGETHLVEVKDGTRPPSERRLTRDQVAWHGAWRGEDVWIVTSAACVQTVMARW